MKKIRAYQCEFCKKVRVNSTQMKQHEEICFFNPKSKSCVTCTSFGIDDGQRKCYEGLSIKSRLRTKCVRHQRIPCYKSLTFFQGQCSED